MFLELVELIKNYTYLLMLFEIKVARFYEKSSDLSDGDGNVKWW